MGPSTRSTTSCPRLRARAGSWPRQGRAGSWWSRSTVQSWCASEGRGATSRTRLISGCRQHGNAVPCGTRPQGAHPALRHPQPRFTRARRARAKGSWYECRRGVCRVGRCRQRGYCLSSTSHQRQHQGCRRPHRAADVRWLPNSWLALVRELSGRPCSTLVGAPGERQAMSYAARVASGSGCWPLRGRPASGHRGIQGWWALFAAIGPCTASCRLAQDGDAES